MRKLLLAEIPALRRYARMLTGDVWAADDLIQDTLERACSKWTLWSAGTHLRAWLFTLMHNQHASGFRHRVHQPVVSACVDVSEAEAELVAPPSLQDQRIDLQNCLLRLPVDQRQVLLLVTVEYMSYDEVARLVGVPVGTVMSRLHRARTRLRELMEGGAAPAAPTTAAAPKLRRLK
jgi:RNA polymerase sigma-70 factor (ECF subfamily)